MAKIGHLALNKGKWKNTQIISEQWIFESTKEHTSPPVHSLLAKSSLGTCGYGYLWWTKDFPINKENIQSFFATGNGGQMIFVFPRLHLAAVFTQGNYNSSLANQPFDMLTDYIIPAMLQKPQVHKNWAYNILTATTFCKIAGNQKLYKANFFSVLKPVDISN